MFINDYCSQYCEIDKTSLSKSYRCPESIISYASMLFPSYGISHSNVKHKENDGIFFVKSEDITTFLKYNISVQLRLNSSTKVNNSYNVITFGKSKGSTYENVLIYPTKKMKKAFLLNNSQCIDSQITLSKCYVALTRAKHKVGIVVDRCDIIKLNNPNIKIWDKNTDAAE
jgi:DNA helicase-2/ATP-dependent DNA helicase PcrA